MSAGETGFSSSCEETAIMLDFNPNWMWCYVVQSQITVIIVYSHPSTVITRVQLRVKTQRESESHTDTNFNLKHSIFFFLHRYSHAIHVSASRKVEINKKALVKVLHRVYRWSAALCYNKNKVDQLWITAPLLFTECFHDWFHLELEERIYFLEHFVKKKEDIAIKRIHTKGC